jgi:hypothetical protein
MATIGELGSGTTNAVGYPDKIGGNLLTYGGDGVTQSQALAGLSAELSALGVPDSSVSPYVLASWGVPSGIAPSGTIGANGAITLGTALPTTYNNGIWLYFPEGALFSGSAAGSYYCVMSSTTAGVAYGDVLTGVPARLEAPTPIISAGTGAYVGVTGSDLTLFAKSLNANQVPNNGTLNTSFHTYNNNSAGAKIARQKINGVNTGGATTSTITDNSQEVIIRNRGVANQNIVLYRNIGTAVGQAVSRTTIDFGTAASIVIAGQIATATDYIIIEAGSIVLFPI